MDHTHKLWMLGAPLSGGEHCRCSECEKHSATKMLPEHQSIQTAERPHKCPEYEKRSSDGPIVSGIRKLTLEKGSICVMNVKKPSANDITLFSMNSSTLGTAHIPAADVGRPITDNTYFFSMRE